MSENTENNTDKRLDNLKEPWKEGDPSPNPNGRPKGQRNYATIYREALIKLGEANNKTPEELEEIIEQAGLKQAMKGNFPFFKDIRDRIHGKPVEKKQIEVTEVKPLLGGQSHGDNETTSSGE
jgi:hypothetical protein